MALPVLDIATYDAYGNLTRSTGTTQNSYRFAGEQFDNQVGQYYLRARYYDTSNGRFSGRDPFEGDMLQPLSLAKYPYVHGNPVNGVDPSGLFLISEAYRQQLEAQLEAQQTTQTIETVTVASRTLSSQTVVATSPALAGSLSSGLVPAATITIGSALAVVFAMAAAETAVLTDVIERIPGFPMVIWGNDIPETTQHTYDALRGQGQTMGTIVGITGRAPTFLARRERWNHGSWYDTLGRIHCTPEKRVDYALTHPWILYRGGSVCDEYPYATTWQGGRNNYDFTNRVSIKLVPAYEQSWIAGEHNLNNQSFMLSNFYNRGQVDRSSFLGMWFVVRAVPSFPISIGIDRDGRPFPLY